MADLALTRYSSSAAKMTSKKRFAIATRKTYGRTSDGMICSTAELNLGTDHSGILVLPEGTAEPGTPAAELLGLDDVVFNLAITPER